MFSIFCQARHTIEEPVSEHADEEVPNGGHTTGVSNAAVIAEGTQATKCQDDSEKPPNLIENRQRDPTCEQRVKAESDVDGYRESVVAMDASIDDASPDDKQARRDETKVLDEGIASHEAEPLALDNRKEASTLGSDGNGSHSAEGNIEDISVLDDVKDGSIQTPEGVLTNGPCEVKSGELVNATEQDDNGQQASTEDLAKNSGQTNDEEPTNRDAMADKRETASNGRQIDGVTPANSLQKTDSGQPADSGELEQERDFELANKNESTNTGERMAIDEENSGELGIENGLSQIVVPAHPQPRS